jgi:hypothetical protein
LSIAQPANVSTPDAAFFGFAVHDNVPGPPLEGVPPVIDNVTEAELPVTVLPPASWTVTTGWLANATPPVPPPGCVVKRSREAEPTAMLNAELVPWLRPPLVAVSV